MADVVERSFQKPANTDEDTENLVNFTNISIKNNNNISNFPPTSLRELKNVIKLLKKRKAKGYDQISNEAIQALPNNCLQIMCNIFNACLQLAYFPSQWKHSIFQLAYFPSQWKHSIIITILKPGKNPSDPNSYRPISLLPAMGKLFERIISIRLTDHMEKFNLIENLQFGFRRGHSTTHQVLNLIELITSAFNKKNAMAACFLDFEKAFDRVWHDGLIHKLTNFMLPHGFIKLSQSYLKRRSFQIRCGDTLSSKRIIFSGVPQGSVLGPIFFNIYINDMPHPFNTKILKYADDTVALVESRNPQNAITNLQLSINIISKWCHQWKINLNPGKCSVILFRRYKTRMRVNTDIKINDSIINNPDSYKYLGVIIDKNLNFKEHISYILNKANAAFYSIYPIIGRKSKLNIKIKKMLYISLIRPILLYACPAWAIANKTERKKLDVIQNKILRSVVNAPCSPFLHRLASACNSLPE
ncbi:RNA-directed DNA polymerase from mobile element jockey, partial [Stegodyphus mimosarum]